MAWKHNGRIIQIGKAWIADDNTKHPRGWANWSADRKKAMSLVWEDDPVVKTYDDRFYNSVGKEKNLTDVSSVNSQGKPVINPVTGKQVVSLGLKSIWINYTKTTAKTLLKESDWEVTRKAEKGTAMASATSTYRDKVRTACDTIETKINNCSNLTEFKELFKTPVDSDGKVTGKAPIYDFPDEV
mgnify:CR=1 FL=1